MCAESLKILTKLPKMLSGVNKHTSRATKNRQREHFLDIFKIHVDEIILS